MHATREQSILEMCNELIKYSFIFTGNTYEKVMKFIYSILQAIKSLLTKVTLWKIRETSTYTVS